MHFSTFFATATAFFASAALAAPAANATPAPNFYYTTSAGAPKPMYVTMTACKKPQTSGSPNAWQTTGTDPTCTQAMIMYATGVPQGMQQIGGTPGNLSLLRSVTLNGFNSAFSFGSMSLNCALGVNYDCQQTGSNYAVSFYGNLYDTTNVWLGPGKVRNTNGVWGNYLLCAIPGQPMVGLTDPVDGGGYVMPGEAVMGNAAYRAPTPIPASLGTPVTLPTPPPM